jgi:hypothetical protein
MSNDHIVEEVRAARRAHAEQHGNDLTRIFCDSRSLKRSRATRLLPWNQESRMPSLRNRSRLTLTGGKAPSGKGYAQISANPAGAGAVASSSVALALARRTKPDR